MLREFEEIWGTWESLRDLRESLGNFREVGISLGQLKEHRKSCENFEELGELKGSSRNFGDLRRTSKNSWDVRGFTGVRSTLGYFGEVDGISGKYEEGSSIPGQERTL